MTRTTTLFTKRPQAGVAKTRLSPPLLPEDAARLAEAMLLDSAERLGQAPDLGPRLAIADGQDQAWFEEAVPWIPDRSVQIGDGLGQRLANHFKSQEPGSSAIVIGSDQPLVPLQRLREAHELLEGGADVVLGPDQGGGYYLVGLGSSQPDLFLGVVMSSVGMCGATAQLAEAQGLRVEFLAPELDVDTGSDLQTLRDRLLGDPDLARRRAPRTCSVMETLAKTIAGI